MEQDLDAVEHGEMSFDDFMKKEIDYVSQLMTLQSKFTKSAKDQSDRPCCPACHVGKLFYRDGKNGRFWSCSEWKNGCNATFSDDNGKPAIYDCPICHNGYLIRYKKTNIIGAAALINVKSFSLMLKVSPLSRSVLNVKKAIL